MRNNKAYAPLAQLVEHLTLNQGVQGSNPWRCILKVRFWHLKSAGVGLFILTSNKSKKREKRGKYHKRAYDDDICFE